MALKVSVSAPGDGYAETYIRGLVSQLRACAVGASETALAATSDALRIELHGEVSRWLALRESPRAKPWGKHVASGFNVEKLAGIDIIDMQLRLPPS